MNEWCPGDDPNELPEYVILDQNDMPLHGAHAPPTVTITPEGVVRWPDE